MIIDKNLQKQKAKDFLLLHTSPEILILPNVWDASSTKIFETENYKAIGTASAGVSAVMGYPDGQVLNFDESLPLLKNIIACTSLPVSVDIEAGYSNSVEGVVETAKKVLDIGGIGINLEDSTGDCSSDSSKALYDIEIQCDKISAIREMADKEDIHLLINARTDVFLLNLSSEKDKIELAVERATRYYQAGADCIFIPDVGDLNKEIIQSLVKNIEAPINIIAGENIPNISELENIGVSRVSFGPRMMRATFDLLKNIAKDIKTNGNYNKINNVKTTYSEVNNWFVK